MMRLTPVEVLNAVTINAAYSVNRQDKIGSFDTGKQADITILDAKNIDYPLYFFATNLTHQVYKAGKLVVDQGRIVSLSKNESYFSGLSLVTGEFSLFKTFPCHSAGSLL